MVGEGDSEAARERENAALREALALAEAERDELRARAGAVEDGQPARLGAAGEALEQARDAALAASRAKGYFLATMSHELRTPLNAIIGYAELATELLREGAPGPSEGTRVVKAVQVSEDVERIRGAARHLLLMIDNLLDLSKIEAGSARVSYEYVKLGALLDELERSLRPSAARQGNSLEFVVGAADGELVGDRTRLRQILYNLLSNALKFTRNGRVSLEFVPAARTVEFVVRDTGIGIAEEDLERLFEPFSQLEAAANRRFEGAGLGLTLTRSYCRMFGGAIRVESALGEGSCFTVSLPRCPPKIAALRDRASSPELSALDLDGVRPVVLIDDDAEAREAVERLLGEAGVRVLATPDVSGGIELVRRHGPRLAIVDVLRRDGRGLELLDGLVTGTSGTPVLVLSQVRASARVLQSGAAGFILKPASAHALLRAVRVLSDQRSA